MLIALGPPPPQCPKIYLQPCQRYVYSLSPTLNNYSDSIASTSSNLSVMESQSRRLRRQSFHSLSPGASFSRSSSRRVLSLNSFSRSVSRGSLSRSFTKRQLMQQMQESKRRYTKEEVYIAITEHGYNLWRDVSHS